MKEVTARLYVSPEPKGRPKFTTFGGHVHTYTPKKTELYERRIKEQYIKYTEGYKFEKGQPICVNLVFGMPIPASSPKSRKRAMAEGIIRHTKKPDIDNMIKSVLDALNGVAWVDDSQIVRLTAMKLYCEDPYVYIKIYESVD